MEIPTLKYKADINDTPVSLLLTCYSNQWMMLVTASDKVGCWMEIQPTSWETRVCLGPRHDTVLELAGQRIAQMLKIPVPLLLGISLPGLDHSAIKQIETCIQTNIIPWLAHN